MERPGITWKCKRQVEPQCWTIGIWLGRRAVPGDRSCVVSPAGTLNLVNGDYKWRIRDYGATGYGSYTAFQNFTLNTAGVELGQPSGTLTSWDKSFNWTGLSGATWYNLEVQTSGGTPVLDDWYLAGRRAVLGI